MRYVLEELHMLLGDRQIKGQGHTCPDCNVFLRRRTSEMSHSLLQQVYWVCPNIDCGGTYAGRAEITHRLSPPRMENPAIGLPYSSQSEFARSITARVKQIERKQKAAIAAPLSAHTLQIKRERIARMLERGYGLPAIQEALVCSAELVISVRAELEKSTGAESEQ